MNKKILFVATVQSHICQFHLPIMKMLKEEGFEVHVAARNNLAEKNGLQMKYADKIYDIPFERSPFNKNNIKAYKKLNDILKKENYNIVHCNTPVGGMITRLASNKFRKKGLRVIYTAHGFHFYKGAPIKNWIIYYPIEKFMASLTDVIITMNEEDYNRALTFNIDKVYKVNGVGLDLNAYKSNSTSLAQYREEFGLKEEDFVIAMIAEVNKNKNHKQIIDAIEHLNKKDIKLICAGEGILLDSIKEEIEKRNLQDNIKMLGFRKDIDKIISVCDIGVLMSYREGLPRNIMELMSAKKTVIGTNIRGIKDLIEDEKTGYLVEVGDYKTTANKIEKLYNNKNLLKELSDNCYSFIKKYDINNVLKDLKAIYS